MTSPFTNNIHIISRSKKKEGCIVVGINVKIATSTLIIGFCQFKNLENLSHYGFKIEIT